MSDETKEMPKVQDSGSFGGPLIPSGSNVSILVSKGPRGAGGPMSDVPDVVGLRQADALTKIQEVGFEVQVLRNPNASFSAGTVSHQLPVAGAAASSGSTVSIIDSTGPLPEGAVEVALPDVVGKRVDEASRILGAAGLKPAVIEDYNASVVEGIVYAQEPNMRTIGRKPARKSKAWLWALLAAAVVVAAAAFALLFTGGEQVEVPDVTGMTVEEAETALENAGLVLGRESAEETETVEPGRIISQDPEAGKTVSGGSRVNVVVAGALEGVKVPDVVGRSKDEAVKILEDAELEARAEEVYSEDVEEGSVVAQSPQPGIRVDKGAEIGLSVSKGPEPPENVEVPDVSGKSRAEASDILTDAKLTPRILLAYDDTVPIDDVVTQVPSGGTIVAPGTRVAVVISQGPKPPDVTEVEVPRVEGLKRAEAEQILKNAGFEVEVIELSNNQVAVGVVFAQQPAAGKKVAEKSTVAIMVSTGPME